MPLLLKRVALELFCSELTYMIENINEAFEAFKLFHNNSRLSINGYSYDFELLEVIEIYCYYYFFILFTILFYYIYTAIFTHSP